MRYHPMALLVRMLLLQACADEAARPVGGDAPDEIVHTLSLHGFAACVPAGFSLHLATTVT